MTLSEFVRARSHAELGLAGIAFLGIVTFLYAWIVDRYAPIAQNLCPQVEPLIPGPKYARSTEFYTPEYSNKSLSLLQGAIRIPTVSYDDMSHDVLSDPRFKIFKKLHAYLLASFPLTAHHVETVNEYALLYTFEGTDPSLKPVILAAHQDVVPVAESSLNEWDYPPFAAHYDGEFLYGRGATDTKTSLVAILEAVEALLEQHWQPERTLLLAFGFDEELGGPRGAAPLAATIHERYGEHGVEVLVDEGAGIVDIDGIRVAAITVTEKGYTDVLVRLDTTGGHSSQPPDHTSIGIISEFVKLLEDDPFEANLAKINPILNFYQCAAEHAPDFDSGLKRTLLSIDRAGHWNEFTKYLAQDPRTKYSVRTSQAVDVIHGGTKVNALPERVEVTINHRINVGSTVADVRKRFERYATQLAREHGLGVIVQNKTLLEPTRRGHFDINLITTLEVAPVSPWSGEVWDLVAGTTLGVFTNNTLLNDDVPIVAAPALLPANTDTRHYWNVTKSIYRYRPSLGSDGFGAHTVNERQRWRSHLLSVAWYYEFIQNTTD